MLTPTVGARLCSQSLYALDGWWHLGRPILITDAFPPAYTASVFPAPCVAIGVQNGHSRPHRSQPTSLLTSSFVGSLRLVRAIPYLRLSTSHSTFSLATTPTAYVAHSTSSRSTLTMAGLELMAALCLGGIDHSKYARIALAGWVWSGPPRASNSPWPLFIWIAPAIGWLVLATSNPFFIWTLHQRRLPGGHGHSPGPGRHR